MLSDDTHPSPPPAPTTATPSSRKNVIKMKHHKSCHKRIYWWITHLFNGLAFVTCLLPGYCKLFWFYFFGRARICVCYNHGNNEKKKESGSKYLDIYGGGNTATKKKPVLIFVPGGTWQIHARYYAMPLGRALSLLGILIVVPDYTRYSSAKSNSSGRRSSQGNTAASSKAAVITDMIQDIDNSIQWVFDHIEEYGGDKTKVALAGQSAGGHLVGLVGMLKLLDWVSLLKKRQLQQEQTNDETTETAVSAAEEATMKTAVTTAPTITMKETKYDEEETIIPTKITNTANFQQQPFLKSTYTPTQLLGYIPTSSPLDLLDLCPQFFHSGIVSPMKMNGLFGGICKDDGLDCWSPMHVMECCFNEYGSLLQQQQQHSRDDNNKHDNNDNQQPSATTKNDIFPRFAVIHGTSDHCVPIRTSEQFVFKYNNFYNNLCSGANNSGLLGEDESLHENHQNKAELITYEGWSHTDLIIERPMEGDHSYHRDLYELIRKWSSEDDGNEESMLVLPPFDESHPMLQKICPSIMVRWARAFNPFN